MKIVLDVSAAFVVITGGPASDKLMSLLESASQIIAPDLYYSEATNAAWKYHHIEDMSIEKASTLAEKSIQLVDFMFPSEELWREAFQLGCSLSHPIYDCYYLVLAKQQDAILLTLDKRLLKLAKQIGVRILEE